VASGLAAQEPVSVPAGASVDAAAWLAGCWMARNGGRRTEEVWMAPAGGVMVGMGRVVRPGRPASWEHLLLGERDGVLTYTALPSGQSLTHFPLVAAEPGRLRFENPGHDFPRALEYRRPAADSLLVHVFGAPEDPEPAFSVRFARDTCPP
jgi:hypothetical protein